MLEVKNISFRYAKKPVLQNLSFEIEKGEVISIIGASGCGKSTLLQAVYGLHHTSGTISWNKNLLRGPHYNLVPGESFMKYLAQNFDLMPSLSAADNVGKYLSNAYPRKKQERIDQLLELVEMYEFRDIKARFLSGGQQQRIALARVLANPPEILLLDEPFSHIDSFRKNKLRRKLFQHFKKEKVCVLIATHDTVDALSFADRCFVMSEGKIISEGDPEQLYQNPKSKYVASLFGEVNHLPSRLFSKENQPEKHVLIYPHEFLITKKAGIEGIVETIYFRGSSYLAEIRVEEQTVLVEMPSKPHKGQKLILSVPDKLIKRRLY